MKLKMKFEEVLKLNTILKSIIDNDKIKINVLLKFRLLGIMQSIRTHIENFEIVKNEKIVEYGKKNKDGTFQISKDNVKAVEKFKKDIEQILGSEVTISIEPLKPAEVFDKGLTSEYLMGLYQIIK